MMLRSLLLGTIALAALPAAVAEPVPLKDAVHEALRHSPAIAQAEASLEQSLAGVDSARASAGPTLGVQGQIGVTETDFSTGSVSQEPMSIGLQGEWPVYTSGANAASLKAAGLQSDASRNSVVTQREQVVLQTLEAYANAWLAQRVLIVGESRVETLRIRQKETQSRFDQGLVTRTDTALTEARLASAEAQQAANKAQYAVALARLERLTGHLGIEPAFPLSDVQLTIPESYDIALQEMLATHPSLKAAENMLEAADYRLKEAEGRFGPKVSLSARATTGEDIYFFFPQQITDAGAFVTVEMPLYTSGMKQASKREALAGRSMATASVLDAKLQLTESMTAVWGDMEARKLAVDAARQAEQAARLASEGAKKEYDAGIRTLVDSLDAENEYRDAQIQRLRAETNLLIAEARILSLLSSLGNALMD